MMVAGLGIFMFLLYVGGFIFVIAALVYLIVKRSDAKKYERFEKRNN